MLKLIAVEMLQVQTVSLGVAASQSCLSTRPQIPTRKQFMKGPVERSDMLLHSMKPLTVIQSVKSVLFTQ